MFYKSEVSFSFSQEVESITFSTFSLSSFIFFMFFKNLRHFEQFSFRLRWFFFPLFLLTLSIWINWIGKILTSFLGLSTFSVPVVPSLLPQIASENTNFGENYPLQKISVQRERERVEEVVDASSGLPLVIAEWWLTTMFVRTRLLSR